MTASKSGIIMSYPRGGKNFELRPTIRARPASTTYIGSGVLNHATVIVLRLADDEEPALSWTSHGFSRLAARMNAIKIISRSDGPGM